MSLKVTQNIHAMRRRESSYVDFYKPQDQICFCVDIKGLLLKFSYSDDPNNWYLFMDSSQRSFKAILIEKNTLKIIPVAYSSENKKETIEQVLNKIKYDSYKWYISGDFKMIGLLMGLQAGNTQHSCFLCQWRSRGKNQYDIEDWQMRNEYRVGEQNINAIPLVNRSNILIPPLHIKLGLFKNFVKAL